MPWERGRLLSWRRAGTAFQCSALFRGRLGNAGVRIDLEGFVRGHSGFYSHVKVQRTNGVLMWKNYLACLIRDPVGTSFPLALMFL